jgi:RNA polymerase sigma factor (sigma-70 family)
MSAEVMVFREPGLLERFRAGNEDALEVVYSQCVGPATRMAAEVLRACTAGSPRGPGEMAAALADVVQEVFIKAFAPEARRRFDASRPYLPYLVQIARHVAIDYWRQMRRYIPSDLEELIEKLSLEEAEITADNSRNDWADPETVAVVERYLASLDDDSRRIHEALYVKGLSQREAAALLGIGRQAIRIREAKLRRGLRRELSRARRVVPLHLQSAVGKESG